MAVNIDGQATSSSEGVAEFPSINENGARDEESPLLPQSDTDSKVKPLTGVATIIAVLLVGNIMSNTPSNKQMSRC
jgi:hypothetical protein